MTATHTGHTGPYILQFNCQLLNFTCGLSCSFSLETNPGIVAAGGSSSGPFSYQGMVSQLAMETIPGQGANSNGIDASQAQRARLRPRDRLGRTSKMRKLCSTQRPSAHGWKLGLNWPDKRGGDRRCGRGRRGEERRQKGRR